MRKLLSFAIVMACIATATPPAMAQTYPSRVITLITPFPAGSVTDGIGRFIAQELNTSLGQPVIIDNKAGADGIIATQSAKRAAPDGYTLLMSTNSAHGSNKALYSNLPYDPENDFEPVAGLVRSPFLLLVRNEFPADDVAGFVQLARQRTASESLNYGSGNTSGQVGAALLKAAAKIDMAHIPYRGTPQALQDLLGGQIDALFADLYSSRSLVESGRLKALAITDTTRHSLFPTVPTMAEAGYEEVQFVTWGALFAPAGTDRAIIERLNREINTILAKPEATEALQKMAMTPMVMTTGELRDFVSSEIVRWGKLVEYADIPKK